jgi:hypothetical protein
MKICPAISNLTQVNITFACSLQQLYSRLTRYKTKLCMVHQLEVKSLPKYQLVTDLYLVSQIGSKYTERKYTHQRKLRDETIL